MIKFIAHSSAPIQYLNADAKRLLRIMGKAETSSQGIITEEQLPAALLAIEQAIAREESEPHVEREMGSPQHLAVQARPDGHAQDNEGQEAEQAFSVSLRKRALPLLQLLRAAQADKECVIWQD